MLNEFIEINPILKALGCDLGESHPSFKRCPKKKGFIIFLDKAGHVEDVSIPDFSLETVYRWQKGKKDPAFPVFNARAFCEVTCDPSLMPNCVTDALKEKNTKKSKKKVEASSEAENIEKRNIDEHKLQAFIAGCNDLWKEDLSLIGRSLNELPTELLCILEEAEENPGGYSAYKDLVTRARLCYPEKFCEEARKIFMKNLLATGKKEFAEGLFALKKKGKKGRGKEHGRDFLYLLTIKDWDKPEHGEERFPPYHSIFQSWMARIFEQHSNKSCKPTGKKDAFGLDMAGAEDLYDDIDVGIGQIKLFASNKNLPCLKRYGLEGTAHFPAGRNSREMGRKSLEYILDKQREGTTWRSLRKYENRNTVAFAYCTRLRNANVIQIFDDDDTSGQDNIYISEEATKTALKTLEGIVGIEPAAEIVIGIIAALDNGNAKVLASRRYPLSSYISGAVRWQEGCINIPDVVLPWLQKKENLIKGALSVYPTRVIWLLNSAWRQNGEMITRRQGNQKVPISKRFTSSDALDFLFEKDETIRNRVDAGLENIVDKSVQTLIMARLTAVLNQSRKGEKLKFNNSGNYSA